MNKTWEKIIFICLYAIVEVVYGCCNSLRKSMERKLPKMLGI